MANSNGNLMGNLPILDGKNWDQWCVHMRVIFGFQDVMEVVNEGFPELRKDVHRKLHKGRLIKGIAKPCFFCTNM
jgi:hypothetical protein